jgi:hypothetical protein
MTRAWKIAMAATAVATAAVGASAQVRVERYVYEQPRYYAQGEVGPDYYREPGWRNHDRRDCRAARWDPNQRYMPGQAVWRNGKLYVATDVSANVYNVNSPPEWTPNYWAQVNCRR